MPDKVKGKTIDAATRCIHYHSQLDIIAIKFKCCGVYYPCFNCHAEESGHPTEIWNKNEFEIKAILCGVCRHEMTIHQYVNSNNQCLSCGSKFNPKCASHYHFYFEV